MRRWGAIAGIAVLAAATLAWAAGSSSRVPKPVIEIERPGKCVEATEVMRRDHARLLLEQRDRTMRAGVRTKPHSFTGCVECHASSKTGSVLGPQGFCESCHTYASVRLDCFECHAAKPQKTAIGARR